MPSRGICPSVRLFVTFVYSVETNEHIFKIFSRSGRHTILVFYRTKLYNNIPTGTPLKGQKLRCFTNIWLRDWSLLDRRMSPTFPRCKIGCSTYAPSVFRNQQTPQRHASVSLVYYTHTQLYYSPKRNEIVTVCITYSVHVPQCFDRRSIICYQI